MQLNIKHKFEGFRGRGRGTLKNMIQVGSGTNMRSNKTQRFKPHITITLSCGEWGGGGGG